MTFATDQVTTGISSCSNTRAFGPDKLSIFHIKHLGSRGIEYLTAFFNDSVTSCRIPSIWKSTIVIPIPKPDKDFSLSNSNRPISLLCPAAKVMEALLLPTVNSHLLPSAYQHGFRPGHSTTSALLQLTSDIATGFNQMKPPHRRVCVAVDLTAAFETVNHNVLLSKIVRSTKARIVHTGVPQGSKMSSTLFSFYLADMPRPTEAVKRICYADDITVWASGVKIQELEHKNNAYLTEMSCSLRDNSLLISAPKSTVTLFIPDPKQSNTHPKIKISDAELPLVRNPKLLGVYLDTLFSFNTLCVQVANRISKRNNVLKALTGTNWGQQKETLLLTLGRSISNYAAPVWSTNAMLLVEDHLNLPSAQYLVYCIYTDNVCHHITTMDHPPREMKETLH